MSREVHVQFEWGLKRRFRGSTYFVMCFQYKEDVERFYERLKHRMKYFGLELEEKKIRQREDMPTE